MLSKPGACWIAWWATVLARSCGRRSAVVSLQGAFGSGRVYAGGDYVGDTSMAQVTVGLQLGGQAFSQIIFFEDKRAFD